MTFCGNVVCHPAWLWVLGKKAKKPVSPVMNSNQVSPLRNTTLVHVRSHFFIRGTVQNFHKSIYTPSHHLYPMSPFPLFTLHRKTALWMMYGWEQVCGCHFSPYPLTFCPRMLAAGCLSGLTVPGILSCCKMWSPVSLFLMVESKFTWCIHFLLARAFWREHYYSTTVLQ